MAHFGNTPSRPAQPNFTRKAVFQAGPVDSTPVRTNAYGAKCAKCAVWVEPGQGRLTNEHGRWVVSHIPPCPEKVVEAKAEVPLSGEGSLSVKPVVKQVAFKVVDGRYTVVFEDDTYKTVRVSTQDKDSDFMPGRVLLSYLSGPDNDHDYTRFGHVDESGSVRIWKKHQGVAVLSEAVKVLLDSPDKASTAYAQESKKCSMCGRNLTVPASLNAGRGPDCAKKAGL